MTRVPTERAAVEPARRGTQSTVGMAHDPPFASARSSHAGADSQHAAVRCAPPGVALPFDIGVEESAFSPVAGVKFLVDPLTVELASNESKRDTVLILIADTPPPGVVEEGLMWGGSLAVRPGLGGMLGPCGGSACSGSGAHRTAPDTMQ